jgi:hypothetical protein
MHNLYLELVSRSSREFAQILIGAPARCSLGGKHRAFGGAALSISRRTEPRTVAGAHLPAAPSPRLIESNSEIEAVFKCLYVGDVLASPF